MFIDIHVHAIQEETMPRPDNGSQPISTPEVLIRRYGKCAARVHFAHGIASLCW